MPISSDTRDASTSAFRVIASARASSMSRRTAGSSLAQSVCRACGSRDGVIDVADAGQLPGLE